MCHDGPSAARRAVAHRHREHDAAADGGIVAQDYTSCSMPREYSSGSFFTSPNHTQQKIG